MRVANIKTTVRKFYHHWITVTFPLHNLGKTERGVLSELLYYQYLLSQEVSNPELVDKLLFEYETKGKICDALGIPKTRMQMILTKLRKEGMVIGKRLNKSYIPELKKGDNKFIFAYSFNISDNDKKTVKSTIAKKVSKNSKKT